MQALFGPATRRLPRPGAAGPQVVQREPDLVDADREDGAEAEALEGSANLVYRVRYGEAGAEKLGASRGYFKPITDLSTAIGIGIYDHEQAANTLATSRLAERLSMPVARERSARHVAGGVLREGTVSAEAVDAQPLRDGHQSRDVDLRWSITQKGLSDLQLFDAIVGQADRRGENILIGKDGAVTGIDEEATFGFGVDFRRRLRDGRRAGVEDPDDERGLDKYLGLPSLVDRETAERVLRLDPKRLGEQIAGEGSMRLPEASQDLLARRLARVQAHLAALRDGDRLVDEWNDQTFAQTIAEPMIAGPAGRNGVPTSLPRSYIARHFAERRAEGQDDGIAAPATTLAALDGPAALSAVLGRPIGAAGPHAIPQIIHRFWTGNPMSPAAAANLDQGAQAARGSRFRQMLWYSQTIEQMMEQRGLTSQEQAEMRRGQRAALVQSGYELRAIEDLAAPEPAVDNPVAHFFGRPATHAPRAAGSITRQEIERMAAKAVAAVQQGGPHRYDELKHFSDIARLMYLHAVGGHHFDVDMGLGDMDLDRSYHHADDQGNVPLLGSLTAVTTDPIAAPIRLLKPSPARDLREQGDDVRHVARHARDMAATLNGMIASRPGTPHLASAIDQLRGDAVSPNTPAIPSGMLANKTLIYGSDANEPKTEAGRDQAKSMTVPAYLLDLQHLTDDSDNR